MKEIKIKYITKKSTMAVKSTISRVNGPGKSRLTWPTVRCIVLLSLLHNGGGGLL